MKRMRGLLFRILLAAFSLFLITVFPSLACAQFNSSFTGTVVDQSGAVIPGARITVVNQATNVISETTSTATGTFRVSALSEGTYQIEVTATGFSPWRQGNVTLESNQIKTLFP